jgi:hypothetical protein
MIKQNWNIDSEEVKRILIMHENATKNFYLIKEQTTVTKTTNEKFPEINLGDKFEYGKYDSPSVKLAIEQSKPQIEDFIKKSDSSNFTINISAGESQVTNPEGFETQGSLALARANSVKKYFEELFPEQIKSGVLVIKSPQSVDDVYIGTTPYGGKLSGDLNNPELKKKYKDEQFVKFDITGEGSKTIIDTKKFCNTPDESNKGKYLSPNQDYTQIVNTLLDYGEGNLYVTVETYTQADILYFEYNGKIYGDTKFRGENSDDVKIFLGTALMAKYGGGQLPPQFGETKYTRISMNDKRILSSLDEMKSWGLSVGFKNTFSDGSPLSNEKYMNAFKEFDADGKKNKLLKTLGPEFPWGIVTSKIESSVFRIGPVPKIMGIDDIKFINVAPIGHTQWRVTFSCEPPN